MLMFNSSQHPYARVPAAHRRSECVCSDSSGAVCVLQMLMFLWLVFTAPDLSSRDALLFRTEGALPQAADSGRLCGPTDGVECPGDVALTAAVLRRRYGFELF